MSGKGKLFSLFLNPVYSECCKRCQQCLQREGEWPSCVMTLSITFSFSITLCQQVCMCIDVYDYAFLCVLSVSSCHMYFHVLLTRGLSPGLHGIS